MKRGGFLSIVLLFASQPATATALESVLERHRPSADHSVLIIAKAEGVLRGDVPVLVVLFTFVSKDRRDPVHGQYLAVLPREGFAEVAPQLPSLAVRVGGAVQHFSAMTVSGGLIHLEGKAYAPDDPRCCPSRAVAARYRLDGQWLTALATPE